MLVETLTISRRFCGPSQSGNGGYVCGRIARHIPGAAAVRLMLPPPLETEMRMEADADVVRLLHGDVLVGEACPTVLDVSPPAVPSFAAAQRASEAYLGFIAHSFPRCFVCGPQRTPGDGMCIFAGPLANSSIVAAPWIADVSLARGAQIANEFLWAALDCPSAFAILPVPEGRTVVLGELRAQIVGAVRPGERCVVIGWPLQVEGRKRSAGSAVFSEAGAPVAIGRATWIDIAADRFPPEPIV
ncbi:MAG TPA: hypothetical protein PKK78_01830 [Kouleothrix sp.]|jgi:hypothetical protein|nr:hypothetical protein [Kouleothrix sp.]